MLYSFVIFILYSSIQICNDFGLNIIRNFCNNLVCLFFFTGVEVTNTAIGEVNMGSLIVESDSDVTFDLNLRVSSNFIGSSITGVGLWSVDIYTSDTASCETATSDRITSTLSTPNQNKQLSAGALLLLNNVRATVPLPDALCENINFVCAELGKGAGASPNFTLVPVPDQTALLASTAIECKGTQIFT